MKRALLARLWALIVILGAGGLERARAGPPEGGAAPVVEGTVEQGLVGHWKLQGYVMEVLRYQKELRADGMLERLKTDSDALVREAAESIQ